nr:hypothetical protein [Mycoplasmopsis bovis]
MDYTDMVSIEDDVLTAGRYYYAGWNPSNREETYKLNPHYRKENPKDPIAKWKESRRIKEYRHMIPRGFIKRKYL